MGVLRYSGPFWFLASIPLLHAWSDGGPLLTPATLLCTLLVAEYIPHNSVAEPPSSSYRLLPIFYIPCQLLVIAWSIWQSHTATTLGFTSLVISTGVCTGVFGVLAAHEMVHSRVRWHRRLGALMLTGMSYRHFRIAHVHGHHRYAATDRDASTARLGEGFYAFFLRTLGTQIVQAWHFERRRCRGRCHPFLGNRMAHDAVIIVLLYAGPLIAFGWRAAAFLAAESAVAILVLELFNYIAHYGLRREMRDGRVEPVAAHHSWNSSGAANLLIFNMGRHSDHHRSPSATYEELKPVLWQPELPYGYAGSILLALVPPLWRAVMDPHVAFLRASSPEMGYVRIEAASPNFRERAA
ncbi:MAG: alkane 1-monooxygenase [Alphaproteobacteria bacterium]|nr:alkane 1-monooxygenase [Alphaproteobacteria bacterium]